MKDKASPQKGNILVNSEILKSTSISVEELRDHLDELKSILGARFDLVVPRKINDTLAIRHLIDLRQRLQKLKQCDGFDRHIRTHTRKQLQSNYFVTVIASHLFDKVDSIIMEPSITGTKKASDILVNFREERVYLECKCIDTSQFDYSAEHEHMFLILRNYIDVPHQIDIRFRRPLSDEELHRLGEALRQRARKVTGTGRIIHNAELEVEVQVRKEYADKRLALILHAIVQDLHTNCYYPGHVYIRDGITLSLSGPRVDYTKILKNKITKSRCQSPPDAPYVLMIDGNTMLGELEQNIRAFSSAFQPTTNTRFSAAVLVTYHPRLDTPDLDFKFHPVSNAFAKFPLSQGFARLFHT